jgi:O-antigen ligase
MLDTLQSLFIRAAPLAVILLAGLIVLALVTRAYRSDGTLSVSSMIRALLIVALVATVVFPREFFGVGVNTVTLSVAFVLFGLSAPSQGLNARLLIPYLIFAVPFALATGLHIIGGGDFDETSAFRALTIGVVGSFLMANYFNSSADLKPLFAIMLPVLIFTAGLSLLQAITGNNYLVGDLYNKSGQDFLVAFGFGSNNVLHAMAMMAGLAISAYFYFTIGRWKMLFMASAGLLIAGLVISSTQSAWGGTVVMGAVIVFLVGRGTRTRGILTLVAVIGLTVFMVFRFESVGAFSPVAGLVRERSGASSSFIGASFESGRTRILGGSFEQRLRHWEEARRLYATSPVWGVGFSEFGVRSAYKSETHNVYLTWATETGILGLSGFLLMLTLVFARSANMAKNMDPDSRLAMQLLLGLLAGYLFVGIFWHIELNRMFWLTFGLLGGLTGYGLLAPSTASTPPKPQAGVPRFGGGTTTHRQPVRKP